MKRVIAAATTALLASTLLVSFSVPAQAAPTPKTGTASVKLTAPKDVPANVLLRKRGSTAAPFVAAKPGQGVSRSVAVKLTPGTYTASVPAFVYRGVAYGGKPSTTKVVVRAGAKTSLSATVKALPGSKGFAATEITTTTADLQWTAPSGAAVALRRAVGTTAPSSPKNGANVKVARGAAHVTGLTPGTTYSYSLFTRVKGVWTGPLTLRSRTIDTVASPDAGYVANPGTVFTKGSQIAKATLTGQDLALALTAGAPVLQAGSGVVVPATSALPAGYLGIVTGIAPDGRTAQLRPAGLADVFQQYDLHTGDPTLGVGPDESVPQVAAPAGGVKGPQSTAPSRPTTAASRAAGAISQDVDFGCSASGQADVEFQNSLAFHRRVDMTIDKGNVAFDLGFSVTATGALSVETTGTASCSASVFSGTQTIPANPVPLIVKWDVGGSVEVTNGLKVSNVGATATGGFGAKGTLGTRGFSARPYTIASAHPLSPVVTTDGESKVTLALGGSVDFGIGTGNAAAGVLVGLKGELYPLKVESTLSRAADQSVCTTNTVKLEWSASLVAEAWFGPKGWWGSFDAEATKKLVGGDFDYIPEFSAPTGCDEIGSGGGGGGDGGGTGPGTGDPGTPPATDTRTIESASTSSDLNCTLDTNEDFAGSYYGGSACGTFLAVGGTMYGPGAVPASSFSATPWTPVSQSDSGSGTADDPYRTQTVVTAGDTGIDLVQTDTWVAGGTAVDSHVEVRNTTGTDVPVRLYRAFDCYTADDDTGTGGIDLSSSTVGCVHVADSAAVLSLRLTAVTPGATVTEGQFTAMWEQVAAQGDLDGQAVLGGDYDNGEAVAWSVTVPAGTTSPFDVKTWFAGPM